MTRQSDALRDRLGRFVTGAAVDLANETLGILREVTPVDTGAARAGWRIEPGAAGAVSVRNDEEHVRYLNEGSSKQAPAGFVEAAVAQAVVNVRARRGRAGVRARDVQVSAPGIPTATARYRGRR